MEARIDSLEARVLQLERNERKRKVDDERLTDIKVQSMLPMQRPPRNQLTEDLYIQRGTTGDHSIRRGTPEQALTFFATAQLGSTMEVDLTNMSWDNIVSQLNSMLKSVKGRFQIYGSHRLALERLAIHLNLVLYAESDAHRLPVYFTRSTEKTLWAIRIEKKSQIQDDDDFRSYPSGLELIVVFDGKIK